MPAAAKVELTKAGELLVELYDSWGRPEKAAEWQTKLARPEKPKPKP